MDDSLVNPEKERASVSSMAPDCLYIGRPYLLGSLWLFPWLQATAGKPLLPDGLLTCEGTTLWLAMAYLSSPWPDRASHAPTDIAGLLRGLKSGESHPYSHILAHNLVIHLDDLVPRLPILRRRYILRVS